MNTNDIILGGINAILNQLILTAVAEAIKPLHARILALEEEEEVTDWKAMEHVAAKAVQPMQDRIVALEINQTLVSSAKINLADLVAELVTAEMNGYNFISEAVRNVLDGGGYVKRNEVVDLVETVVGNAIEAYDFSDIIDWDNKIEEGINNYDFTDIIQEMLPEELDKDVVQEMIDEALDNLTISRN